MSARKFGSECITPSHLRSDPRGIGYLGFHAGQKTIRQIAARVAYRLYVGEVKPWQAVSHRCGNGRCLNPSHLYLRPLMEARADKGSLARLTPLRVWYIRRSPLSTRQLAAKFDYAACNISLVRLGKLGRIERFSWRYALLIAWEILSRRGRRDRAQEKSQ